MPWTVNRPLGLTHHDPERAEPGYTLFSSVRGTHATLLDMQGREVHRWHSDEGIQYGSLIDNGHLLVRTLPPKTVGGTEQIGGSSASLIELDADSKVVWRYDDPLLHHDCLRLPNGNTIICLWEKLPLELSSSVQGGHEHHEDPPQMWADVLREITPDGKTVWEWRSWEHLDFAQHRICPLESRKEWTHLNSVQPGPDGTLLVSFRLSSVVALLDRQTGALRWSYGPGELSHQHHATWLPDGHVLIFDNGCHRPRAPSFSRVVEVDPAKNEIVWRYQAPTVLAFFSFMVSGAERLAGGNTFITEGATGRLFEVTKDGDIVWEYVSPHMFLSQFGPTPAIFRAHRYRKGDPRLAKLALTGDP
jgi:hypothetical protein